MKRVRLAGCIVTLAILQGCSLVPGSTKTPADMDIARKQLSLIDTHLLLMHEVTSRSYQEQIDMFDRVVAMREENDTAHRRLREALLLVTSGHPNSDRGRGYAELQNLLAAPEDLSDIELSLARVILNEIENVMIIEAQNAELTTRLSDSQVSMNRRGDSERSDLNRARRDLANAQEFILRLEAELADARAKLEAIKRIETTSE